MTHPTVAIEKTVNIFDFSFSRKEGIAWLLPVHGCFPYPVSRKYIYWPVRRACIAALAGHMLP